MTTPSYALLTESAARRMKVEALSQIVQQAIGMDLHHSEYIDSPKDALIRAMNTAKSRYWERAQVKSPIANNTTISKTVGPKILPASEINDWLQTLPAMAHP